MPQFYVHADDMKRIPYQAGSFWAARRMCAWLLIALIIPGSLAGSALVWCVSSDGHTAVEFSIGPGVHHSALAGGEQSQPDSSFMAVFEHLCHDTNCVDVPAVSSTVFANAHRFGETDKTTMAPSHEGGTVVLALLPQTGSLQIASRHSRSGDLETRNRIDPTILSQRVAVLRI